MENLTFKEWLLSHYDNDELKNIAENGCANVAPHGMVYYSETTDLYNQFCDDLHEIVGEYMESTGMDDIKYLSDNLGSAPMFKNAMVWLCAEIVAYDAVSELLD